MYSSAAAACTILVLSSLFVIGSLASYDGTGTIIRISTASRASTFDGVGALSAGTGPRLLIDYDEPFRSQILDYMFRPNFGASFQVLKIEIGGTGQSTDGTEATHEPMPGVYDWNAGYEWWLAKEAAKRNPNLILYGLPWSFPGWLQDQSGDPMNNGSVTYLVDWVEGAKKYHNLTINYLGFHNESPWKASLVIQLRKELDARGLTDTLLVLGDAGPGPYFQSPDLLDQLEKNIQLSSSVAAVGWHYPVEILPIPNNFTFWEQYWSIPQKKWASEDFSTYGNRAGGNCWAKLLNRNFVIGNMTMTLAWDSIAAWYDWLPFAGDGLMFAMEPWSGHYVVPEAIWATAHTTQFTEPGWFYLRNNSGSGVLPGGGTYVSFVSPDENDYTLVIETMDGNASKCAYEGVNTMPVPYAQAVTFCLDSQFCSKYNSLHCWRTRGSKREYFVKQPDLPFSNCCVSLNLDVNAVYTLSTVSRASHGKHRPPPPSEPFPFPYETTFDEKNRFSNFPLYFTDQGGIFRVTESPFEEDSLKNVLEQICLIPPVGSWGPMLSGGDVNPEPVTVLGSTNWTDYTVSLTGRLNSTSAPFAAVTVLRVGGRLGNGWYIFSNYGRAIWGYWLSWSSNGMWALNVSNQNASVVIASGNKPFDLNTEHSLSLRMDGSLLSASLDGTQVVTQLHDDSFSSGPVGVGCGWHACWLSHFVATFNIDENDAIGQHASPSYG